MNQEKPRHVFHRMYVLDRDQVVEEANTSRNAGLLWERRVERERRNGPVKVIERSGIPFMVRPLKGSALNFLAREIAVSMVGSLMDLEEREHKPRDASEPRH